MIQAMFFAAAGIIYAPLGIWMLKNRLYSRAPYVISILVSAFLIGFYVWSRLVGIENNITVIDLITNTIEAVIIVLSAKLLPGMKKKQIIPVDMQDKRYRNSNLKSHAG